LSVRYSNSPAFQLIIGKSRLRRFLHTALCLCTCFALYLLSVRGYSILAFLLLPPVGLLLWRLRCEPMSGAIVRCRQDSWTVDQGETSQVVCVLSNSTSLPWVIYLAWRELPAGRRSSVWLFADSAPPRQLRRLRARLSLQG